MYSLKKNRLINLIFNYATIPLISIITWQASRIFFFFKLKEVPYNVNKILLLWFFLQIIFSVILGMISDKFCRKKVLNITVLGSLISVILLDYKFYFIAVIINGVFGNILPIALASYSDVHVFHNKEANFFDAFIVKSCVIIALAMNYKIYYEYLLPIIIIISLANLFLVTFFFKDFRDKKPQKYVKSVLSLVKKIKTFKFYGGFLIIFFLSTAWFALQFHNESFMQNEEIRMDFFLILGVAMFTGGLIARIFNFDSDDCLFFIVFFVFLTFLFNGFISSMLGDKHIIDDIFLQFSILSGIAFPLFFMSIMKKTTVHQHGTAFGLVDSIIIFSEVTASSFLVFAKESEYFYLYILPLSFFAFLLVLPHGKKIIFRKAGLTFHKKK